MRQELCLYPLPQVSHLSSPEADFFLVRFEASLARRPLAFVADLSLEEMDEPVEWCCGRLLGGGGTLPRLFNDATAARDEMLLLFLEASVSPLGFILMAADIAAALVLAALRVVLLRRVTRCA